MSYFFRYNVFQQHALRNESELVSFLSFVKLFYRTNGNQIDVDVDIVKVDNSLQVQVFASDFDLDNEHMNYLQFEYHPFLFCDNVNVKVEGNFFNFSVDFNDLSFRLNPINEIDFERFQLSFNLPKSAYNFDVHEIKRLLSISLDFENNLMSRKINLNLNYLASRLKIFPGRCATTIYNLVNKVDGYICYISILHSWDSDLKNRDVVLSLGNGDILPARTFLKKNWSQLLVSKEIYANLKLTFIPLLDSGVGFNWFVNFASSNLDSFILDVMNSAQIQDRLDELSLESRKRLFSLSIARLEERRLNISNRKGVYFKEEFLFVEPSSEIETVCVFAMLNSRGVLKDLGLLINLIEYTPKLGIDCIADFGIQDYLPFSEKRFLEFEYNLYNFVTHGHRPQECDVIVCYKYNPEDFDGSDLVYLETLNPEMPFLLNLVFSASYNDFLIADKRIPVIVLTLLPNVNVKKIE